MDSWHFLLAILCALSTCHIISTGANSILEMGEGARTVDEDDEFWNSISIKHCPESSYIAGFSARFSQDEKKLTALRFYCTRKHVLSELPQRNHHQNSEHHKNKKRVKEVFDVEIQTDPTGVWRKELLCQNGVVNGLQIKLITTPTAEQDSVVADGFASDLRALCSNGEFLEYGNGDRGVDDEYWAEEVIGKCHERQAACGFQAPFSSTEGGPSSIGLECCTIPDPTTTCHPKKNFHHVSHCDNPISSTTKTCQYERRVGTSYAGKEDEVQIYENLGFQLAQAGPDLQKRMGEVSIDPMSDNDGSSGGDNWLPEGKEMDEISAAPGISVTVYQLIGHCGFYKIRLNSFKAESLEMEVEKLGEKVDGEVKDVNEEKEDVENDKKEDEKVADEKQDPKKQDEVDKKDDGTMGTTNEEERSPKVQDWMVKHDLKEEDLEELEDLMQADAAPWDPADDWGDEENDGFDDWDRKPVENNVPASEPVEQEPQSEPETLTQQQQPAAPEPEKSKDDEDGWSEENDPWDLDFPDPEPSINNVPIQNSQKINSVSNPHEFIVDVPLSPVANLAKPPAAAPASAPLTQHEHQEHDHKPANLQQNPAAPSDNEQEDDDFMSFDDDFFKESSQEEAGQDNRRESSGFNALKPDEVDVEDHSNHQSGHQRNQQQQMMSSHDLIDEDGQGEPGDDGDLLQHQGHESYNADDALDVDDGPSSAPEAAAAKVNNAILGYIVGGMVVAVCIIVIIIFVLEKRKPRPRDDGPVKRGEYTSTNLEPRLLGGGGGDDVKPGDRRFTIEEEKETA